MRASLYQQGEAVLFQGYIRDERIRMCRGHCSTSRWNSGRVRRVEHRPTRSHRLQRSKSAFNGVAPAIACVQYASGLSLVRQERGPISSWPQCRTCKCPTAVQLCFHLRTSNRLFLLCHCNLFLVNKKTKGKKPDSPLVRGCGSEARSPQRTWWEAGS